uniref:Uncharacterized protein n=1 Tax=Rhizophora mucronata TaxID=61149 RepID=A0A2P2JQJ1_RHIMU
MIRIRIWLVVTKSNVIMFYVLYFYLLQNVFCMQVGVKNLKVVTSHGWTLMHEGEAEKQVYPFFSPSFGLNLGFSMPYPLGSNSIINQGN